VRLASKHLGALHGLRATTQRDCAEATRACARGRKRASSLFARAPAGSAFAGLPGPTVLYAVSGAQLLWPSRRLRVRVSAARSEMDGVLLTASDRDTMQPAAARLHRAWLWGICSYVRFHIAMLKISGQASPTTNASRHASPPCVSAQLLT
jgi:hypothetical protein